MMKEYKVYMDELEIGYIQHDREKDLFSMVIERPDLFPDRLDKLIFTDEKVRQWIESRLTPEYQKGYDEFVSKTGVDISSPNHRWELFVATHGANVKDRLWVSFSEEQKYETHCPWYKLRRE